MLGWFLRLYQVYDAIATMRRRRRAEREAADAMRQIEERTLSGELQQARLGTLEDARKNGLMPGGALYLGVLDDELLFYSGDESLLTYGASGTGKFRDVIGANLAHATGHSIVMTDPKGEGAWCTGDHRHLKQNQMPCYANPWNMKKMPNHRLNPLQYIIDQAQAGMPVIDEAYEIVEMLFPNRASHGANAWIQESAAELFHFSIVHLAAHRPDLCTLGTLWDIANCSLEELETWLVEMQKAGPSDGFVARKAVKFIDTYPEGGDQLGWVRDAADKAVRLYGPDGALRDAVSQSDFDLSLLKTQPSTVYLMIPGARLESHGQWLALLVNAMIETVARTPGPVRTTFILDEFGNLPRMPAALKALRLYRSAGVQLWPFVQGRQSLEGSEAIPRYGRDGRKEFEDQAHIHQMWGIENVELLRELQDRAGYRAVLVPTRSTSVNMDQGSALNAGEQVTPILPIAELARVGPGRQILKMRSEWIWIAERYPWWEFDHWAAAIKDQFPGKKAG